MYVKSKNPEVFAPAVNRPAARYLLAGDGASVMP